MEIQKEFLNPGNERRVLQIVHGLSESAQERRELLDGLKARGFGGVVTNVSFKDYLVNEKYWADFSDGLRYARSLGMELWLYDEEGYPSGLAGGLTQAGNPEYQSEGVSYYHIEGQGNLSLALPPGELIFAGWTLLTETELGAPVNPLLFDAASRIISHQGPDEPYRLMAFVREYLYEGTHAAANVHKHQPYINIMDDRAVNKYIHLTHDAYEAHLRNDLGLGTGQVFKALFTDEPSLMTGFLIGDPQPAPVIPWCYDMQERYQERWGQSLLPELPLLFNGQGALQARARYRFWQTAADLVETRYFGAIQRWAKAHGIASSGHQLYEESVVAHAYFYGDFMQSARRLDWPSIDQLTSRLGKNDLPLHAKLLGSVAELIGAERVMSESSDYIQMIRKEPPATDAEIRGMNGWLYLLGVNVITSYYNAVSRENTLPPGVEKPQRNWEQINSYLGRLGVMTQSTHWLGEIGVAYPIEAVWAHFITQPTTFQQHQEPVAARQVDEVYQQLGKSLLRNRYDFILLDRPAMVESNALSGRLHCGNLDLRCLILPQMQYIAAETMRRAHSLWQNGGLVIAYGCLPEYAAETGLADEVTLLAQVMFGAAGEDKQSERGGRGVFIAEMNELLGTLGRWGLGLVTTDPDDAPIAAAQRRLPDGRANLMLLNDSNLEQQVVVRAPLAHAELWDPETGLISPLAESPIQGVHLVFLPQRALFLVEVE